MRIFIEGYDTGNWGDVLMATASALLASRLQPQAEIVFPQRLPFTPEHLSAIFGGVRHRVEAAGLFTLGRPRAAPRISGAAHKGAPGDVVLFCNGSVFGDDVRLRTVRHVVHAMQRLTARGVRTILMPQTFAWSEDTDKAALLRMALENAALAFTRDAQSNACAQALAGEAAHLVASVEYTGLLNASPAFAVGGLPENRLAIVPNVKIGERFGPAVEDSYVQQLADVAILARDRHDLEPVILVHTQDKDDAVAERVVSLCNAGAVIKGDPLAMRRFIGGSRAVIASRFHALSNALSQNVPAIALGCSPKFTELLKIYGLSDYSVDVTCGPTAAGRLNRLLTAENSLTGKLRAANAMIAEGSYRELSGRIAAVLKTPVVRKPQKSGVLNYFRNREVEYAS
jgi:polysaccharide pyruvyl transferase WcaK-like protein